MLPTLYPSSMLYVNLLKFMLNLFGVDPSHVLEEISLLEDAVCDRYHVLSEGRLLHEALRSDVESTLLTLAETVAHLDPHSDASHPILIYKKANAASRNLISTILLVIGRVSFLRHLLQRELIVSFVGTHNAGKSTAIHHLFGLQTSPSALTRTEKPMLYALKGMPYTRPQQQPVTSSPPSSRQHSLSLFVADFPGQ